MKGNARSIHKELRDVVRDAQQQGWTLDDRNNHPKLRKGAASVVMPRTPSDRRTRDNLIAELRRHGTVIPYVEPKAEAIVQTYANLQQRIVELMTDRTPRTTEEIQKGLGTHVQIIGELVHLEQKGALTFSSREGKWVMTDGRKKEADVEAPKQETPKPASGMILALMRDGRARTAKEMLRDGLPDTPSAKARVYQLAEMGYLSSDGKYPRSFTITPAGMAKDPLSFGPSSFGTPRGNRGKVKQPVQPQQHTEVQPKPVFPPTPVVEVKPKPVKAVLDHISGSNSYSATVKPADLRDDYLALLMEAARKDPRADVLDRIERLLG